MSKGELRAKIIDESDDLPDGFKEFLSDWIDDIEGRVSSALCLLEISSISDLDKIEDAKAELESLKDALW